MSLQIIVLDFPRESQLEHPPDVLKQLISSCLPIESDNDLRKCDRLDLSSSLVVSIRQVVSCFKKTGQEESVRYWERYLAEHPISFLTFGISEVKLVY